MNVTGLWAKYAGELAEDPLLVVALTAALIAFATTPIAFAILGRSDWFKARRGRVMQRPEFSSIVAGMMLVMAIPAIFSALVLKSRSFDRNRYEFDPNKTWSVLEQGRGFKSVEEADAAVKLEMERLSLERKNLVDNVKKLDESMLALRAAAGTSPAVAQAFPSVLQSLAGVRKSVGVDGPQQLQDFTAPPAELRNLAAGMPAAVAPPSPRRSPDHWLPQRRLPRSAPATGWPPPRSRPSWPPCPSPRRPSPPWFPWPTCRRAGPSGKSGEKYIETFNADNLYEKIDGRAESFLQYGVKGMAYTFYHPAGDASNEIQLYIFEMADPLKALGKYGSEKPDEAKTIAVGTEGYTTAGSTLFYAGKYYTQIVSTQDDPKFAAFALELAKRVAASQKPGGKSPAPEASAAAQPVDEPGESTAKTQAPPKPADAQPKAAAEVTPATYFALLPAGGKQGDRQVSCPGCFWLQLPLRRLHGRLQGRRGHLAGLPPPLPGRQGGQGSAPEIRLQHQARRGRGSDCSDRGGRRDVHQLQHRSLRRRLSQGQYAGRRQRCHQAQAGRGLRPGPREELAGEGADHE